MNTTELLVEIRPEKIEFSLFLLFEKTEYGRASF